MNKEHKLCPFCGGKPELLEGKLTERQSSYNVTDTYFKYISCTKCRASSKRIKTKVHYDSWDDVGDRYMEVFDKNIWDLWDARV